MSYNSGRIRARIANQPRASHSADFEISCAINPWTALQLVQLQLLIYFSLLVIVIGQSGVQFREKLHEKIQNRTSMKREADLKLQVPLFPELYGMRSNH